MASIIRKGIIFLLLALLYRQAQAQSLLRPFNENVKFVQYLQNKEQYRNAIIALNEIPGYSLNLTQQDTLNYLKGWSFYNMKALDSSAYYLLKVGTRSGFYLKSRFFGAYNYIYLHHYDSAGDILNRIPDNRTTVEIKSFENAGIALLNNKYKKYDSLQQNFSYNLYALSAQEKIFSSYKEKLLGIKKRSPLLAGILSAIVPGTGKIYAGKTYQGIASMLPIAALALLTNESYHKRGPRSAEFYVLVHC